MLTKTSMSMSKLAFFESMFESVSVTRNPSHVESLKSILNLCRKLTVWQQFCKCTYFFVFSLKWEHFRQNCLSGWVVPWPTSLQVGFNPFASEAVYTRNFFATACRTACKHAFCFLRVLPEAVSTRHSWLWQTLDDVYTRRCFSESEGTRFGAPGQKALPSVNEFTLLWIFA